MDQYHKPQTKKVGSGTGGSRGKYSDKRLSQVGGVFAATKIAAKERRQNRRIRGGKTKVKLKAATYANIVKEGKTVKAKMIKVLESHNPEYIRQNIITKGAVVETEIGKARITNRIGQDGIVNAVLVK